MDYLRWLADIYAEESRLAMIARGMQNGDACVRILQLALLSATRGQNIEGPQKRGREITRVNNKQV